MIANGVACGSATDGFPIPASSNRVVVDLGSVDDIPLGQGRAYVVGQRTIAVFRQRDGRVFAIDNQCPHRGGPLAEGVAGDGKVICPLHGWKIDLSSGKCLGESASVHAYDAQQVGERVVVFLPE
jgi:nitrite reductase (NADH) small subunit